MAIATVPTGSTSSISLSFASTSTASLATSLLASVDAAAAENNLVVYPQPIGVGPVGNYIAPTAEFVVTVAGAVTVPAGYNVIVDAVTTGTPTITGNGASGALFIAGDGNFDYTPTGGSGTVLSGAGNDLFVAPAFQTGSGYTFEGDESFTAVGVSTFVETIITSGTYTYSEDNNGLYQPFYVITNTAPGATTVNLNAYSETVSALSNGGVYNDNSYLTFINEGANTVVASANSKLTTIFGSNFNMLVTQGADTASLMFVNGAGDSTISAGGAGGILAFDGAGGTINLSDTLVSGFNGLFIPAGGAGPRVLSGSLSPAFNYLVGSTGAETLNAAGGGETAVLVAGQANAYAVLGRGGDAFFGGSGASTVVGGTASGSALPDLYAFVNGASGGSDVIQNWGTADSLVFLGYGAAGDAAIKAAVSAAPTNGASVSITLPDSTSIIITGLNGAAVNLSSSQLYLT